MSSQALHVKLNIRQRLRSEHDSLDPLIDAAKTGSKREDRVGAWGIGEKYGLSQEYTKMVFSGTAVACLISQCDEKDGLPYREGFAELGASRRRYVTWLCLG